MAKRREPRLTEGLGFIRGVNADGTGVIGRAGTYDVTFKAVDYHGDLPFDHEALRGRKCQFYVEDCSRPVAKGVRLIGH
jgi:hypothetical protein